jgi:hypothetical protein
MQSDGTSSGGRTAEGLNSGALANAGSTCRNRPVVEWIGQCDGDRGVNKCPCMCVEIGMRWNSEVDCIRESQGKAIKRAKRALGNVLTWPKLMRETPRRWNWRWQLAPLHQLLNLAHIIIFASPRVLESVSGSCSLWRVYEGHAYQCTNAWRGTSVSYMKCVKRGV